MTRARRAALIVLLLGSASVLVAGDARGNREAVSPAQTVTSRDGGLTVSVPRGALSKPTRIRVRTLTRAQYPPELRNATVRPGSKLYELEPSGLRFLKPVKVTRRIDTRVAGFEKDTVQGVVLASRDRSGKWELLRNEPDRRPADRHAHRQRDDATLLDAARPRRGLQPGLMPREVEAFVGDEWIARVVSKIDNRRRRDPISIDSDETRWSASGAVGVGDNLSYLQQKFVCVRVGTGTYRADVTVAESSIAVFLGSLGGRYEEKIPVSGQARCKAKATPPPPAPRVARAHGCVRGGDAHAVRVVPVVPALAARIRAHRAAGERARGADGRRHERRPAGLGADRRGRRERSSCRAGSAPSGRSRCSGSPSPAAT